MLRVLDALQTDELCPCNWKKGEADAGGGMTAALRRSRRSGRPSRTLARDIKLNLQTVLADGTPLRRRSAGASRSPRRPRRATPACATPSSRTRRRAVGEAVVEDALAAAALMAMNNVYYRFRHVVGKPVVRGEAGAPAHEPPRQARHEQGRLRALLAGGLRAINGCEACVRAHEKVVVDGHLTEDQVHDAVRIAATIHAAAVALEIAESPGPVPATEAVALV